MNAHRRTALKPTLRLETLDERIAPAHLGIGAASHAAVAHHPFAVHARAAAHVHSSAMHANTARLAAVARASTGRVIGSTMPATFNAHNVTTMPLSPARNSVTRVVPPRPGTMPPSPVTIAPPAPTTTTPPITITAPPSPTGTTPSTLPANADGNLNTIYQQYLKYINSGGSGSFSSSLSNMIQIQGTSVGVEVHGKGTGDFNALVSSLESMGMQISATDAVTQTVAGMLPIADLPAAAQGQQTLSVTPMYRPMLF